jgi:branched-chain amino acid transport system substrate-binding protein
LRRATVSTIRKFTDISGDAACGPAGIRPRPGGGDGLTVTWAGARRDGPADARSRAAPSGPGLPAPDGELHSYIRAFAGCGADSASFFWRSGPTSWFRIRLEADRAADVRVAIDRVALPHRLTARELDVLTLLAIGFSNAEIGARLGAGRRTVDTHVEHVLAKLGQGSRTGAAAMAVERGYLRLPMPGLRPVRGSLAICRLHERVRIEADLGVADDQTSTPQGKGPGPERPTRRRPGDHSLLIGSAFPLGGLAGDDGRQMLNGSALAVGEINARGGIGGRLIEQVVVDVDIFSPDAVDHAFRQLFEADVDALTSGYVFPEAVASDLAARYGAPYLHAMTSQSQAETVRENHSAFKNVFQVCPTEVHYGPGFIRFLDQERARGWQPPNRRIAFVDTDMPSGQLLNARTVSAAERSSWEICAARTVPAIGADWASLTDELERLEPAAVMIAQFLAGELAAFQRFAAARLPATVIYAIYAPSVPEFLKVADQDAEGIVWATVTGTYDDAIGQQFRADYAGRYGQPPGWSHAGIAYDEIHLLARAWMAVPQPRDFEAVSTEIRRLRYRGVNGSYFLDNAEQSGLGFPDTTPDPSLGLAHLVLQVQDGMHRIISPAPYAESRFRAPSLAATTRPPG